MYLNKVFLYGNLTRDPELRALPSGQQVASFAIATNRTYKNKEGEKQEATEFHNIVAFGRLADLIGQYLKKGRPVFVEGRLQTRSWEKDGEKKYRTEIVVDNFQFGPSSGGMSSGSRDPEVSEGGAPRSKSKAGDPSTGPSTPSSRPRGSGLGKATDIEYPAEDISPEDIPF